VGEVRDPRVITGLSRGTYITILALRPRTSRCLLGVAQELIEFSCAIMQRETMTFARNRKSHSSSFRSYFLFLLLLTAANRRLFIFKIRFSCPTILSFLYL